MRKASKHTLVCLGAGHSQVHVIHKAKDMGYRVIAIDLNSEAPGFALSDEALFLSTHEASLIIECLNVSRNKHAISGVINRSSGPPVVTAAEICKALNLPGVPPDIARAVIDKSQLMVLCEQHGIPAPHSTSFEKLEDVDVTRLQFPCVVRPALSLVGKSGVRIIKRVDELLMAFDNALEISMNGVVNIEEFIPGRDIVLVSIVTNGQLYPITLIDELNDTDSSGCKYGRGMAVPSLSSATMEETRIIDLARQLVYTLQLNNTPFFLGCRCDPDGFPRVIEIHLDMSGDLILDVLFPVSCALDMTELMIRVLAGENFPLPNIQFHPTAVLFGDGNGFVTERPYKVVTADRRTDLVQKVLAEWGKG